MAQPASPRPGSSDWFAFCSLGREILSTDGQRELWSWDAHSSLMSSSSPDGSKRSSCKFLAAGSLSSGYCCLLLPPLPHPHHTNAEEIPSVCCGGSVGLSKSCSRCRLAALCCVRSPNMRCLKMASSLEKPWAREVRPSWQSPFSLHPGPWTSLCSGAVC